jgi:hypothetical protein
MAIVRVYEIGAFAALEENRVTADGAKGPYR